MKSEPIFDVKLIRAAVKLLKDVRPAPMQWIIWVDEAGFHRKFYGHRQRLAAKQQKAKRFNSR